MGTKNNPGKFDCYVNAQPDEPMFVLLARDENAAMLVYFWATLERMKLCTSVEEYDHRKAKAEEADRCATNMRCYYSNVIMKGKS